MGINNLLEFIDLLLTHIRGADNLVGFNHKILDHGLAADVDADFRFDLT